MTGKIPPMVLCSCGGVAILYETGRFVKGKLWDVYRCIGECGADIHRNPREPEPGDASKGTLFG